jgi:hypothetical protein
MAVENHSCSATPLVADYANVNLSIFEDDNEPRAWDADDSPNNQVGRTPNYVIISYHAMENDLWRC